MSQPSLPQLGPADALIVVDVQNDFCPGGALPVAEGDQVVPVLNRWIEQAQDGGAMIVISRDWHPRGHCSFREQGGPWPAHCIQDTEGARIRADLAIPAGFELVSKGTALDRDNYSDFEETDLADRLRARNVRRVWIGGLAQDVCVRATVLDALKERFETHLILSGTRPVDSANGRRALEEMRAAGAIVETGGDP